jgi:predicted phage terminase large subunit-like protein
MRKTKKPMTLAELEVKKKEDAARKVAEKEEARVAAQQKRKEAAQLRAAAKKVPSEMAQRPDPTPAPQPSASRSAIGDPPYLLRPDQATIDEAFALPYEPPSYHFGPNDDPYAEIAQRELCRRKLLPFIQRFRPKYMAGWVHEDICRRIERFVKQVEAGLSPRLLLMMPPRSGKSEISSRHTPAWILGQHPDWEIIAGSHTSSLSLSFSRYLRDVMRDPAYSAVFPDARLDPSSQSVENWNLTKGGGYLAAGVGTGITGRGAHVLLLDDLVKDMEAADSVTIRDNTWEWYLSTAYTRLAPGGGVLGLMTWWHDDDWAGRIQQAMAMDDGADQFEIIRYPAINDYGDEYILPDDTIVQLPKGQLAPEGSRLTRPMGTAIHPARYTTEMMLKIKNNLIGGGQKRVWDALYQQNPIPDEGNYFSKEMFRYYGSAPDRRDLYIYQAWDFAISEGKESDYTVGTCIGVDHRDNIYYLAQKRFRIQDGGFIIDEILDFAQEWDADQLGFEDGQIWKAIEFQFQKRCEERRQYPSHELLKPLTDKMVRANPLKGRMQLGKVYFDKHAPYFTELMKEMLHFPAGKHDDQIDSLAWAIRLTLARAAPRDQRPTPKVKSWKDELAGMLSGRGSSHMAA